IDIIESDGLTFYKYDFIPGKNLNRYSRRTITRRRDQWGRQIAEFIHAIHHSDPAQIADLKTGNGDGWNHNDICNNMIVDPKTMDIVGLIDWEYSGWGPLQTEFDNTVAFSHAMRQSDIQRVIINEYKKLTK
ncbi:MAG: phosphotransferase, partial [Alphaproteobacteria bacterium]|nr:phosphotransferase [Alphaproteobacteria bacterium]